MTLKIVRDKLKNVATDVSWNDFTLAGFGS